ncbi:hypothetical protein V5O48_018541, partial [Marasmius crinis-equi]
MEPARPPDGSGETICKCSHFCGGPLSGGKWVSYKQKRVHAAKELKIAQLNSTTPITISRTSSTIAPLARTTAPPISPLISSDLHFNPSISAATTAATPEGIVPPERSDNDLASPSHSAPLLGMLESGGASSEHRLESPVYDNDPTINDTFQFPDNPMRELSGEADLSSLLTPRMADEDEDDPPDHNTLSDTLQPASPPPPPQQTDFTPLPPTESRIEEVKVTDQFVQLLQAATLSGPDGDIEGLPSDLVARLHSPPNEPLVLDDADERLSIEVFLAVSNASENTYNRIRESVLKRFPESGMLTFHSVKKLVADLSGITPIKRDMCINSCMAYTGPFRKLDMCRYCQQPRYDADSQPRKQFTWIPIGLQLQALWRNKESALKLSYRRQYTKSLLEELSKQDGVKESPYRDFFDGDDYIDACQSGQIKDEDMVLVLSIDGAQCQAISRLRDELLSYG